MQANYILFKSSPFKARAKSRFIKAIQMHFAETYGARCLVDVENQIYDQWDVYFENCDIDLNKTRQFLLDHSEGEVLSEPFAQMHPFMKIS